MSFAEYIVEETLGFLSPQETLSRKQNLLPKSRNAPNNLKDILCCNFFIYSHDFLVPAYNQAQETMFSTRDA